MSLDIRLKKASKCYSPKQSVKGTLVVDTKTGQYTE